MNEKFLYVQVALLLFGEPRGWVRTWEQVKWRGKGTGRQLLWLRLQAPSLWRNVEQLGWTKQLHPRKSLHLPFIRPVKICGRWKENLWGRLWSFLAQRGENKTLNFTGLEEERRIDPFFHKDNSSFPPTFHLSFLHSFFSIYSFIHITFISRLLCFRFCAKFCRFQDE